MGSTLAIHTLAIPPLCGFHSNYPQSGIRLSTLWLSNLFVDSNLGPRAWAHLFTPVHTCLWVPHWDHGRGHTCPHLSTPAHTCLWVPLWDRGRGYTACAWRFALVPSPTAAALDGARLWRKHAVARVRSCWFSECGTHTRAVSARHTAYQLHQMVPHAAPRLQAPPQTTGPKPPSLRTQTEPYIGVYPKFRIYSTLNLKT